MTKYTVIFVALLFTIFEVNAQHSSKNDIAGILRSQETAQNPNTKAYKVITDTVFRFEYDSIAFDAEYAGDYRRRDARLHFTDTIGKIVFNLDRFKPGYATSTEEGHRIEFSEMSIKIAGETFYVPLYVPSKQEQIFLAMKTETGLSVNGWLIKKVNGHEVLPVFLVKNVKKAD